MFKKQIMKQNINANRNHSNHPNRRNPKQNHTAPDPTPNTPTTSAKTRIHANRIDTHISKTNNLKAVLQETHRSIQTQIKWPKRKEMWIKDNDKEQLNEKADVKTS